MRIGTRIAIGFISALVVVLSLGGLSWRGASELLQTVRRVDHTHDVLTEADAMLEDLVDVEHGTRGYVITGRKEFLEPYQRGIGRLPGDLTQLQALVADNPAQLRRVAALGEVIQRRLEHAANVVALRGSQGFDAAAYQVSVGTGKSIMDEARQQLALFRTEELRLLDEQTARVTKRAALAFGFIAAFVASVVVLLLAAILILTRSLTKPLRALVANARELGAGGKPAITGTERQDEIGDLARAIDDMAQKRAKAEALRRALLEDAPDPFFLADLEGRFTDVNAAACALLGYRREELIGMSIADIIPPEDVPRLAAAKERLLAPGVVEVAEWTHRSRDGVLIPVEVSTKILEGGHWQAFVRDIRKRKRIEDERQVFVSLLENSSDFIGIADPNGKPIYVNPAGRRMVGLPADYPIEQTQIPEYYPPDQRSFAADVILKSMIEHGHWSGETFFRHWQTQEAIPVSDEHFMIREPKSGRLLGMGTITRDISEARRINERLRQSEERFRLIVESVGDYAIFMLDPNGIVTSWNLGAERIEGYRADEIVGQHFSRFYPEEEVRAGVCERELEEAARVGRAESEGWRLRKDGSRFWANVVITAVRDPEGGRLIGFSKVTRDLTERRRTGAALRESEERFRLTIDEAPIGMALVSLEGRFVRVNRALCEIVGYDPAELTGLTFQAITHPDDLAADLALLDQLVRGEIPRYQLGKRYLRKDGTPVDIMLSVSILRGRDGAPLYYIAQIEDITERKRAEEALRESEQRLTLALESARMGIWDSDLIADTTVRSKRHDQIFGHPSPIPDWNMAVLLSHVVPADRDIVRQRFEEAFASGVFEMECRLAWEDGSIHWISSHGRVYRNLEGVPSRMLGTIMDITERKRAEEALQRSEQEFRSLAESMPQIVWATRA
ncbi:MAG: PAS domain S-box protein, partial [Actinomycetota bacterium]